MYYFIYNEQSIEEIYFRTFFENLSLYFREAQISVFVILRSHYSWLNFIECKYVSTCTPLFIHERSFTGDPTSPESLLHNMVKQKSLYVNLTILFKDSKLVINIQRYVLPCLRFILHEWIYFGQLKRLQRVFRALFSLR